MFIATLLLMQDMWQGPAQAELKRQNPAQAAMVELKHKVGADSELHRAWSGKDYEANKEAIDDAIPSSNIRVIAPMRACTQDYCSCRVNVQLDGAGLVSRFTVG